VACITRIPLSRVQRLVPKLEDVTPRTAFAYAGRTLPHTDRYKYLGTTFTPAGAAGNGLPQLRSSIDNAFHSVRFQFDRLGCASNYSFTSTTPLSPLRRCPHVRYGAFTRRRSSSDES